MNADFIQLYSLVGLRALADYDPPEYRRVTDLSRNELDTKIQQLRLRLSEVGDSLLAEIESRLSELELIQGESRSQTESSFLLKQLSNSCLQRAQQLALLQGRITRRDEVPTSLEQPTVPDFGRVTPRPSAGEDFVKLAAMRILRGLPNYSADFNVRIKDVEVDCILRPADSRLPMVFIEAKLVLRNDEVLKRAAAHLKRAAAGWGKGALQVVLTTAIDQSLSRPMIERNFGSVYLLLYDKESNEFVGTLSERRLIDAIRRVQDGLP